MCDQGALGLEEKDGVGLILAVESHHSPGGQTDGAGTVGPWRESNPSHCGRHASPVASDLVLGVECEVLGLGFEVEGLRFMIRGCDFPDSSFGLRVWDFGCRV